MADANLDAWAFEYFLSSADLLRQTADHLRHQFVPAAGIIARARASGRAVSVAGGRTSSALVAAAGLDYGVYQPPGRLGDALLVIAAQPVAPELPLLIAAARANGVSVIALLSAEPSPLADVAEVCLRVPSDDPALVRQAQVVVLRVLDDLARFGLRAEN